jgi:hypothetical protein
MHPDLEQQDMGRRLRELPGEASRPYDFGEFQRRAAPRRRPVQGLTAGGTAAAAAVLALGVIALSTRLEWPVEPLRAPPPAAAALAAAEGQTTESVAMERWLASRPSEPAVVRVGTRVAVNGLEDRIAQVDDLLSAERFEQAPPAPPARLRALQQERSRLVGALAEVSYAEALADAAR